MATPKKRTKPSKDIQMKEGDIPDFEREPDFKSIYVNSTQFGFTKWDFQMVLGRVEISRDKKIDKSRETATIIMTPGYAKALLNDFARFLMAYEQQYGEIKLEGVEMKLTPKAQEPDKASPVPSLPLSRQRLI